MFVATIIFILIIFLLMRKKRKIKLPTGPNDLEKALINNVVLREKKRVK